MNSSAKNKELALNTIVIGVGTIISKALTFLLVPLFSIWFLPEEMGQYDLLVSYISLIVPLITFQIEQAVYRRTIDNPNSSKYFFTLGFIFVSPVSIIVSIFFIAISNSLGLYPIEFSLVYAFYFVSFAIYNLEMEYLRGMKKLKYYSLFNVCVGIVAILLNVVFVAALKMSVAGAMLAFSISYFFGIICVSLVGRPFSFSSLLNSKALHHDLKNMLKYCLPLLPNSLAWWIINVSDRTVIDIFLGASENGIYSISCKIPTLVTLFFSVFNLAFQQSAIENVKENDSTVYFKYIFSKLSLFMLTSSAVVISFMPLFYRFFISEKYASGIICVPIITYGVALLSLAQYLGNILLAKLKNKVIGVSTIVAALINIVGNLLLVKAFGILAAAVTTLISYFIMLVIRSFFCKDIVNFKWVLHSIGLTFVVLFFSTFVFVFKTSNYLVMISLPIASLAFFCLANRSFIQNILKIGRHKYGKSINC